MSQHRNQITSGDSCTPRVVHMERELFDVRIDRATKWGNPFSRIEVGNRQMAIALYERWLMKKPRLLAALPELRGKVLGCHCAPAPCHGDVLLRLANQ